MANCLRGQPYPGEGPRVGRLDTAGHGDHTAMTRDVTSAVSSHSGGLFADLPIAQKILAGFGAVVAILIAVGGIAFFSMVTIAAESEHYAHAVHEEELVAELALHTERMRRLVREFASTNDADTLRAASSYADKVRAELDAAQESATGEVVKADLQAIEAQLTAYHANFDRVRTLKASGAFGAEEQVNALLNGEMAKAADAVGELTHKITQELKASATAARDAMNSAITWGETLVGILALAGLVAGVALALLIGRAIAAAIIAITAAMSRLASGEKNFEVPYRGRKDEVGAMASALQRFKETAIEADRLAAEQKSEQEKRLQRAERVNSLVNAFNEAMASVVQGVSAGATQLRANAEQLSAIAEETNRQSMTVSAAAEEASVNVETVAASAEELNASIGEINRQITQTSQIANEAGDNVRATNATVDTLSNAAQEIGNIVKLIQDIAGQTNLLALNATIEAARAGEAGKGFAVVASEVKTLANQTAKATEEIASQIERIQSISRDSVDAIAKIGVSVSRITEAASTVAAAVNEQNAATAEISGNVQQASIGTREVTSNISQVTEAAGETGKMAGEVLSASSELSVQSERLREVVSKFIDEVRAA
ncbi:MAG: HAMP domain-containing protein [Alphaproteobacteria bacterium]|nr:HAMP domain-containing protein [Alphaproteobacteria bacterium]